MTPDQHYSIQANSRSRLPHAARHAMTVTQWCNTLVNFQRGFYYNYNTRDQFIISRVINVFIVIAAAAALHNGEDAAAAAEI